MGAINKSDWEILVRKMVFKVIMKVKLLIHLIRELTLDMWSWQ